MGWIVRCLSYKYVVCVYVCVCVFVVRRFVEKLLKSYTEILSLLSQLSSLDNRPNIKKTYLVEKRNKDMCRYNNSVLNYIEDHNMGCAEWHSTMYVHVQTCSCVQSHSSLVDQTAPSAVPDALHQQYIIILTQYIQCCRGVIWSTRLSMLMHWVNLINYQAIKYTCIWRQKVKQVHTPPQLQFSRLLVDSSQGYSRFTLKFMCKVRRCVWMSRRWDGW